jgi:REP element-mobilizing transposase RayT
MGSHLRPIVIGYHLVWVAYGWWLPNDPRGSTSKEICCDVLKELGELYYGRKAVQPASREIRSFYEQAEGKLKHPLRTFTPGCIEEIGFAFAGTIAEHRYTCYAAAIMPDHVHLLIRKHKHLAEVMIENFQDASRLRLRNSGGFTADHPVWGGPGWKAYLDHPDEIRRTIRYIEDNPIKARQPVQIWGFVTPYDGWPLHPGHSPSSPYVKRLKAVGRYP